MPDLKLRHVSPFYSSLARRYFGLGRLRSVDSKKRRLKEGLVVTFFLCGPLGALWMLYDCIRQRKRRLYIFVGLRAVRIYFLLFGTC